MLQFQMTFVRSSCKAGSTNLTDHSTMLPVGNCLGLGIIIYNWHTPPPSSPLISIRECMPLLFFGCICEQTNPFKQSDDDIKGLLQPDGATGGNKLIVDVKCHRYLYHLFPEPIASGFFTKGLMEPLSDYRIDTHITHER
jgi:hypothetical protein